MLSAIQNACTTDVLSLKDAAFASSPFVGAPYSISKIAHGILSKVSMNSNEKILEVQTIPLLRKDYCKTALASSLLSLAMMVLLVSMRILAKNTLTRILFSVYLLTIAGSLIALALEHFRDNSSGSTDTSNF